MTVRKIVDRVLGIAWRFSGPAPASPFDAAIERDIRKINLALLPLIAIAFLAAVFKGFEEGAVGAVLLWSVASLSAGATLGFLFGIPKTVMARPERAAPGAAPPNADSAAAHDVAAGAANGRANTNLEEVSDWLTKIVVGLTLVNLTTIRNNVIDISANMAATFHESPTGADRSFACALIVSFFILGFLCAYLYTRIFLQGAFARSDPSLMRFKQIVQQELRNQPAPEERGELASAMPSSEQMQSAERVRQAAPADNPQAVIAPLREMAAEYERVRMSMKPGKARTRAMSDVASRMLTVALAAAPYVAEFVNSPSSGERLAAVMILKARFNPRYSEWLARRLVEDPPFIGYHAAGALLGGIRLLGGSDKAKLQEAVRAARDELASRQLSDPNRDDLIEQILADNLAGEIDATA
jgi:hypothetical protein